MSWTPVEVPQVGDRATHRFQELDPRTVVAIGHGQERGEDVLIFLDLSGKAMGPFLASNYSYERRAD